MGDKTTVCIGRDLYCPCQDGDACHYVDMPGSPAMKPKTSFELRMIAERLKGDVRRYQNIIIATIEEVQRVEAMASLLESEGSD